VKAIARPWIAGAERLEDYERLFEIVGELNGAIECEIPVQAAERDHPVEDVVAFGADGVVVETLKSYFGNEQRALREVHGLGRQLSSDAERRARKGRRSVKKTERFEICEARLKRFLQREVV
jgi:hypothetical protein